MKTTPIEWTHHTVNFWWGCEFARLLDGSISQECVHCYAKGIAERFRPKQVTWGKDGLRWLRGVAAFGELLAIDAAARRRGVRERVFINSMSDLFEDREDLIEARACFFDAAFVVTNLDLQVLTKRPGNVRRLVPALWLHEWPAHVWMGTTCGTQQAADERVPALLKIPAKVRFLSCEPLLGWVDLQKPYQLSEGLGVFQGALTGASYYLGMHAPFALNGAQIHWVICGGESGAGARAMAPDWARVLRNQCNAAGVPFLFKQWGEHDAEGRRVGKKAAGRLLDGLVWNQFPGGLRT